MHESVMQFVAQKCPSVAGKSVLEVGSLNVNGSVRSILEPQGPSQYLGIDMCDGPGVDRICDVQTYAAREGCISLADGSFVPAPYDFVISCEMLEHAEDWKGAFRAMCDLLKPGGTLLLTTRGPGFPRHNVPDYWRFTWDVLHRAAAACGLICVETHDDPQVPGVFMIATKAVMPDAMREPGWVAEGVE